MRFSAAVKFLFLRIGENRLRNLRGSKRSGEAAVSTPDVERIHDPHQHKQKWDRLQEKASRDHHFRTRLHQNPKQVLREEGIDVPDDVEVTVLEFNPKHRYLFIPPAEQ